MSQLAKVFTTIALAYSVSAFTIESDSRIADSSNMYTPSVSCPSTATGIFFGISSCSAGQECVFVRGTTVRLSIRFTPPIKMPGMRFVYQVYTGSSFQELYYAEDLTTADHSEANQEFFYADDRLVPDHVVPGHYALYAKILSTTDPNNVVTQFNDLLQKYRILLLKMDVLPHQLSQSNTISTLIPEEIIPIKSQAAAAGPLKSKAAAAAPITTEKPSSNAMAATSKPIRPTKCHHPTTKDGKFMCMAPGCKFTTKDESTFKRHTQPHNGRQNGPSQTSISTKFTLTGTPCVTSPSIKNFKCNQCSYSTAYKCALKQHLVTHSTYQRFYPFGCPRSEYRSRYKENVRTHWKKEHSGVTAVISGQDKMSNATDMNNHKKILETKNDQQSNCQLDGDDVEPTAVVNKQVDKEPSLVNADAEKKKSNEALLDLFEQADSTELYACVLCDFVGYSEKAAWDHAKCHNKQPIRPNDQLTESPVIC